MEQRLGQNGIDDFRNHPFFEGIDWDNLGDSKLLWKNIFIGSISYLVLFWETWFNDWQNDIVIIRLCLIVETGYLNCNQSVSFILT